MVVVRIIIALLVLQYCYGDNELKLSPHLQLPSMTRMDMTFECASISGVLHPFHITRVGALDKHVGSPYTSSIKVDSPSRGWPSGPPLFPTTWFFGLFCLGVRYVLQGHFAYRRPRPPRICESDCPGDWYSDSSPQAW